MSFLVIRCPRTGHEVPTGIETDGETLQNMPDILAYTRCPHCGIDHAWWPDEAWLTIGCLAKRHEDQDNRRRTKQFSPVVGPGCRKWGPN